MPGVSAFEAICCQGPFKEPRPRVSGLVSACASGTSFKEGTRDGNARAATFRDQPEDRRGVARRLIAGAELSGAVAAIRRWRRWWMIRTGGALATVMPCVLQAEAQKGRGRPVQAAGEICRVPTGPICRTYRSGQRAARVDPMRVAG
jgi:hypothetical protein